MIDTTSESVEEKLSYKDAILQAKEYAGRGAIALFGLHEEVVDERFGYIIGIDNTGSIKSFYEKSDKKTVTKLRNSEEKIYRNLGMMLFQNGTLQKELSSFFMMFIPNAGRHIAAEKTSAMVIFLKKMFSNS